MVLVIGASGTVGSNLVKALKASGARFKVAVRAPKAASALEAEGVPFDLDQPAGHAMALAGVRTVFLGTPLSERQAERDTDVARAARAAGVERIVKLSVIGAPSEPGITFTRWHRQGERAIEASGLAYTFLRPTFFMQNFVTHYGVDLTGGGPIHLANGSGKVALIDARDIGEAAARVLTSPGHEGKAYELTGSEALDMTEACARLSEATGRSIRYVSVPEEEARRALERRGLSSVLVTGFLELSRIIRSGSASAMTPHTADLLGRPPRTFRVFAQDLVRGLI